MYPQTSNQLPQLDPSPLRALGAVLIAAGVATAGLVVWYVHQVVTSPDSLPIILSLLPKKEALEIGEAARSVVIPRELVVGAAYVVFAIIVGVTGGIARTLIAAGAGLLKFGYPARAPEPEKKPGSSLING